MTVETGAIVTNFVANTASFEKGTKQAAKSAQGLSTEALSSASAVAGAFGLQSPAIAAFSNLTGQIMRAQKAHQSMSAAMVGGIGFAGIGIAIGALTANFQALGAAVADVNKLVEDGTVKGVPLQSIWRQIAETYGLVKEQAWALRMEIESQAEYQSRMAKQRSDLLAAERKDWTEVEKAQQLVLDREEELNRAMRDRPKVATEDQTRQLAAIEQAKERATSGAGLFKAGEYDKLMQDLEAKRAAIERQISAGPVRDDTELKNQMADIEQQRAEVERQIAQAAGNNGKALGAMLSELEAQKADIQRRIAQSPEQNTSDLQKMMDELDAKRTDLQRQAFEGPKNKSGETEKAMRELDAKREEVQRQLTLSPTLNTEDLQRQLAEVEGKKAAIEVQIKADPAAGLSALEQTIAGLEKKKADIERQLTLGPGPSNAESDRALALLNYAKAAAEQAQWNELVKDYDEAVKLANEEAEEQARLAREAADAWDAAAEATNRFNTEAAAGAEQTRQTNEEWAKYYQGVQNEKLAQEMVANTRNWERPAATEKGTTADYRAGLSNQDAAMNVQKNIETLNKRMAASLATIEKNLKLETVGI